MQQHKRSCPHQHLLLNQQFHAFAPVWVDRVYASLISEIWRVAHTNQVPLPPGPADFLPVFRFPSDAAERERGVRAQL